MQRIVIDTNVFVSALIQRSYPYLIMSELFFSDQIELCVSEELMHEYYTVFVRKKFIRYTDFISKAEMLLTYIESNSKKFTPQSRITIISDKDDNKLLELAVESKAHFLITGNTNDFTIQEYNQTKIVTPREYWVNHKPQ